MSTIPPVSDPRFDANYSDQQPKKKRSPWATCLIGCLIVCVVLFVLALIVAYWISQRWRSWAADLSSQAAKQAIAESQLPEQEKAEIGIQIDRLATAFRENRISVEQFQRLAENLVQSPLMNSFMVTAIEKQYFDKSGLPAEEKAQARITVQRFIRGMIDKSINEQGTENALKHVGTKEPGGNWEIRDRVTDDELRAFLQAAKEEADKAGVPQEPPKVDPSDEFKRIIDEALAHPVAEPAELPGESADSHEQRPEQVGEEE